MSCMMLSPAHIATVAHGLAYLLNQSEMCQLSAAGELYDALSDCKYPHDFLYDDRKIYPVLYRHNELAYEGRYKVEPDETDEVPAMPDNVPHLLHHLSYNEHYFLDADFFKFLKLLDCFIYQCEEQATEFAESPCKDFYPPLRIRRPSECRIQRRVLVHLIPRRTP